MRRSTRAERSAAADARSHEIERLWAARAAGRIQRAAVFPRSALPAASAAFATRWLSVRGLKRGQYLVLGLGARRTKKQPSSAQVLGWSAHFRRRWGLDTVLMWTPGKPGDPLYPGDDAVAQPLLDAASRGRAPQLHPFRGPIAEALGLIWGARTSLFPDSGLMHFAAASPGGVLGFFADAGVSPAPAQWAPRGAKAAWLEAPMRVSDLPDERVYDQLERLLSP
jgi:ADP-heptose:LPS heptosyltransferase